MKYSDIIETARLIKAAEEVHMISRKKMDGLFEEPDQRTPRMDKATYDNDPMGNDALESNT